MTKYRYNVLTCLIEKQGHYPGRRAPIWNVHRSINTYVKGNILYSKLLLSSEIYKIFKMLNKFNHQDETAKDSKK